MNLKQLLRRDGFTLIEMTIALACFSLIVVLMGNLFAESFSTTHTVANQNMANYSAQEAVERMVDEIRGCNGITTGTATGVTFTLGTSTITYAYDAAHQKVLRNNSVYITGITSFALTYHDVTGAVTAVMGNVFTVGIAVTGTKGPVHIDISTSAQCRNKL